MTGDTPPVPSAALQPRTTNEWGQGGGKGRNPQQWPPARDHVHHRPPPSGALWHLPGWKLKCTRQLQSLVRCLEAASRACCQCSPHLWAPGMWQRERERIAPFSLANVLASLPCATSSTKWHSCGVSWMCENITLENKYSSSLKTSFRL